MKFFVFINIVAQFGLVYGQECKRELDELTISSNAIQIDMTAFNAMNFYKEFMTKCSDKLWNEGSFKADKLDNIYFYDHQNQKLLNYSSNEYVGFFGDNPFEKIEDLIGYQTRYDQESQKEICILNSHQHLISERNQAVLERGAKSSKDLNECVGEDISNGNGLDFSKSKDHLYGFYSHEIFHMVQRNWKNDSGEWKQFPDLTPSQKKESLFFYIELKNRLLDLNKPSISSTDKEKKIGEIKYLYNVLKKDYPKVFQSLNNRAEGTAQYIGIKAAYFAMNGCDKIDSQKLYDVIKSYTDGFTPLGVNSYEINALSSFYLDQTGNKEWKNMVEEGISLPLDALVKNISEEKVVNFSESKIINCIMKISN